MLQLENQWGKPLPINAMFDTSVCVGDAIRIPYDRDLRWSRGVVVGNSPCKIRVLRENAISPTLYWPYDIFRLDDDIPWEFTERLDKRLALHADKGWDIKLRRALDVA